MKKAARRTFDEFDETKDSKDVLTAVVARWSMSALCSHAFSVEVDLASENSHL